MTSHGTRKPCRTTADGANRGEYMAAKSDNLYQDETDDDFLHEVVRKYVCRQDARGTLGRCNAGILPALVKAWACQYASSCIVIVFYHQSRPFPGSVFTR